MQAVLDKFTTYYKKTILDAYRRSLFLNKKRVDDEDLFWALLEQKGSLGYEALVKVGLKPLAESFKGVKNGAPSDLDIEELLKHLDSLNLSRRVQQIILDSIALAADYHHHYVGTEHLLYSLLRAKSVKLNKILSRHKIKAETVLKNIEIIFNSTAKFAEMAEALNSLGRGHAESFLGGPAAAKKESILNFFAVDLTDRQIQDKITPVIGRECEIERVIQILCRRDKNNPVLLGEPGVGKTALVEGLSKKILQGDVPPVLLGKKIYALDMPLLVAGTSYRGEFEARLKQIVDEVKANSQIILFIDEIHNIIGAGSSTGTMDAANILKPALARGEIRCIGATTFDDYKKYIEPDNALSRRLQKVVVNEPSAEEAVSILKGIRAAYERHHQVKITDAAIEEAVKLSVRYLPEQFLPDKAIDLIDEAASRKRLYLPDNGRLKEITALEKQLKALQEQKEKLVKQSKYNAALRLKSKEIEIINKLYQLEAEQLKNKSRTKNGRLPAESVAVPQVEPADIKALFSSTFHINFSSDNFSPARIRDLKKKLAQKIIGQDEVLKDLVNVLKRSAAGLSGAQRPLGSFVFAGPSGVGKTYTAKVLADLISPLPSSSLIKIDMSEYAEKFNASKLIGAPAGYVGYGEGGQLTEKVKRNPYSVILLDEIEKAHSDIFNLFLQILEDGYLTDGHGRRVNFKNTIIIMTTNIGVERERRAARGLGFGEADGEAADAAYRQALQEWLRPELLNRLDKILVFNRLNENHLAAIAHLGLDEIRQTLHQQQINFSWDTAVEKFLAQNCSATEQGARALRDLLRSEVEDRLADKILSLKQRPADLNLKLKHGQIMVA